jgi:hypothetical protein
MREASHSDREREITWEPRQRIGVFRGRPQPSLSELHPSQSWSKPILPSEGHLDSSSSDQLGHSTKLRRSLANLYSSERALFVTSRQLLRSKAARLILSYQQEGAYSVALRVYVSYSLYVKLQQIVYKERWADNT